MRRGFTVVEVMIAVILSAGVVLVAHRVFATTEMAVEVLQRHLSSAQDHYNAQRWLEDALLSVAVGDSGDAPFEGKADALAATTRVLGVQGWQEHIRMRVVRVDSQAVLYLGDQEVVLGKGVAELRMDYLGSPGLRSEWVSAWHSPVGTPLALRLILLRANQRADTTVFLVGGRR